MSIRLRNDSGSVTASNYRFANRYFHDSTTTENTQSNGADKFTITPKYMRAESDGNGWFEIHLFGHSDTDNAPTATWTGGYEDNSGRSQVILGGCGLTDGSTKTCNFVRLTPGTGDFAKAIVTLYGRST